MALAGLVVEDDEPIRRLVSKLLERAGFNVDVASDGSEAIQRLSEKHYNCIVLDLMMAPTSGYDVLNYLNEHDREMLRKTIVISAAGDDAVRQVKDMGVFCALPKPFDTDELQRKLEECVENRKDETLRAKRPPE